MGEKLKVLISFDQKVSSQVNSLRLWDYTDVELPAESQNLTHLKYVICVKRGKPQFFPGKWQVGSRKVSRWECGYGSVDEAKAIL